MKKNDNSLIIAILCGIVVCVLFVGMYILSPKNTSETNKDNQEKNAEVKESTNETEEEAKVEEQDAESTPDEVALGDVSCKTSTKTYKWPTTYTSSSVRASCSTRPSGCDGASSPTGTPTSAGQTYTSCSNSGPVGTSGECNWVKHVYTSVVDKEKCISCYAGNYLDAGACKLCTAGTYSKVGATACTKCPVGTYSGDGASSCTQCAAGTYQDKTGQSSCKTCSSGTYTATSGQTSCKSCPAGSYCSGGSKISCDAGKSSLPNSTMPSDCINCAAGTYSEKGGTCTKCAAGEYSGVGAASCTKCPSDYPLSAEGSAKNGCYKSVSAGYYYAGGKSVKCDAGTWSIEHRVYINKSDACASCPDGKTTTSTGATNSDQCNVDLKNSAEGCYCNKDGTSCSWRSGGNSSFPNKNTSLNSYAKCKTHIQTTCCYKLGDGYNWGTTTMDKCTNDDNITECKSHNTNVCANGKYLNSSNNCVTCEAGHYCNNSKRYNCPAGSTSTTGKSLLSDCTKCTGTNEYSVEGGTCKTCPTGTHPNTGKTACICDYGKYLKDGKCTTCPVNSWCDGSKIIACDAGKASPAGTNSSAKCVACTDNTIPGSDGTCTACADGKEPNAEHSECVSKSSGKPVASITPTGKHYYLALPYSDSAAGSTITVTFESNDSDNKTTSVDWSYTPTNWSYATSKLNKTSGAQTSITFTAAKSGGAATQTKKYTITGKNSATKTADVTITVYCKWNKTGDSNGNYKYGGTTAKRADRNGKRYSSGCYAYEVEKAVVKNNTTYYYYDRVYNRCCGTSSGQTASTEKCYKDANGVYHWTSSKKDGYTLVTDVTSADKCVTPTSNPACYANGDNYYWGTSPSAGYQKVSSITEEKDCKKTTTQYNCYVKDNDYKWSSTAPTGYTKVDGVNTATACKKAESPACYLHNDDFEWGLYEDTTGYVKIEDITTAANCTRPSTEACYKNSEGNYEWGDYSGDKSYTKLPNIKTIDQCTAPIPVPQTALNVSQMIYVFMAVLMAVGIGFIYYANMTKKND